MVQGLQRLEFASIYDLVLAPIAVDEPNRDGQRLVRRVLGHAFEGRDADPSRDEHRRARFVQDEVADWAEDADLVTGPEGRKGALVWRVREADRVFEVGARGTRREGHGARVHALLGLQLQERELRGPEREARRFLRLDRARARCERSRGHDPSPKAPRGTGQRLDLQCGLGAGTRLRYFVTPTGRKASRQCGDVGETGEQPPVATLLDLSPQK